MKTIYLVFIVVCIAAIGVLIFALTTLPPTPTPLPNQTEIKVIRVVEGNFKETDQPIIVENRKPVVYFFTTTNCHYCAKERIPLIAALREFGEWSGLEKIKLKEIPTYSLEKATFTSDKILVRAYELDKYELSPEENKLYEKYNPKRTIPTLIIAGKYFRVGAYPGVHDDLKNNTYDITPSQEEEIINIATLIRSVLAEAKK